MKIKDTCLVNRKSVKENSTQMEDRKLRLVTVIYIAAAKVRQRSSNARRLIQREFVADARATYRRFHRGSVKTSRVFRAAELSVTVQFTIYLS